MIMETIGSRIRQLRGKESQGEFAARIGISKGSLGGYERDENSPSAEAVLKICQSTNISVEWLLTGQGQMKPGQAFPPVQGNQENSTDMAAKLETITAKYIELSEENRKLWKENAVLREMVVALEAERYRQSSSAHGENGSVA